MLARSILRCSLVLLLAGPGAAGCTDRRVEDDGVGAEEDDGDDEDDAAGDDAADPDSLAGQGIAVYGSYYEGSIMTLDFTTHPAASCDDVFPTMICDTTPSWSVSLQLVGRHAAPGVYHLPDMSHWDGYDVAGESDELCSYHQIEERQLAGMTLTIDQASPEGIVGRVDEMATSLRTTGYIAGSFHSISCQ